MALLVLLLSGLFYLVDTAASVQTRESINELLASNKQYDLAKAEALNILNIGLYWISPLC